MSRIQQIDAEIAALEAERKQAFFRRNEARGAARKQGFALGLSDEQVSAYYKQDPDYIAAKTEYAIIQGNIIDLQQEKEAIYRNDGFPEGYFGGATTQYTTTNENGDAASVVTRTSPTGTAAPVSQTIADVADPEADIPETTATPQTSTADQPIPFISDETYLDPLYEPAPTSPTVGKLPTSPFDINQDGVVSDSEYLYGDDELYEPVPTDDELASLQEQMDEDAEFAAIDEEFATITGGPGLVSAEDIVAQQDAEFTDEDIVQVNPVPPSPPPPRSIKDARKPISETDWRFRVRLSPFADYLYNAPDAGILAPLKATDGVLFPYTPQITMTQTATYNSYNPTHSNFRGHFYQSSQQGDIIVNATFTAQDTNEAQYMLAVIHFFRAASKMFYGQNDNRRGTPPPLLYMNGLGEYQFNEHPCLLSMITYTLPDNVDYIKTSNTASATYQPQGRTSTGSGYESWSSKITRLITGGLEDFLSGGQPSLSSFGGINGVTKITDGATYVPTQLTLQLNFLPVNTRQQVSQEYSSADFASGKLLKKGYW